MANTNESQCRTLSGAADGPRCYRCEAARTRPGTADCAGAVHLAPVAPAPRAELVRWEPESSLELTVVWCDAAGVEHTAIATVYDDGVRLTGGADPGAECALLEEQLDEDYRGRQRLWSRARETAVLGQDGDELRAALGGAS